MRKGISWCVGAGNGSTSAALVLPSAKSNKQRSILPSKECPLFIWSRKRESNPPGSAWEADAIPLGDSCIFCCIVFVSRFHGNGSTFAQLRFRFARSVAGARPRTGSAWEADAKNRVPAKILRSKRFVGKGGAGIEAAPRRRRGRQGFPCSDAAIPARIEFLYFYYSGKEAGCQAQKMRDEEKFSRILALFRRVFCMIRHNRTKRSINRLQSCGIIGIINPREEP